MNLLYNKIRYCKCNL